MRTAPWVPIGLFGLLTAGAALVAQSSSSPSSSLPSFSTRTDLVVLHVTVKDSGGAYVSGLGQEAFAVLEEGRPQSLRLFSVEDTPVTVGLIIDNSASMHPNRERVTAAAAAFAESSNPDDELFALVFDDATRAALPAEAPFTSDPEALRSAVHRSLTTRGRTALFDAIVEGVSYLSRAEHERQILVVLSDGSDNASRATLADVLQKTQGSNVLIYTVAIVDPAEFRKTPKALRDIARSTGGDMFAPRSADEIGAVLRSIAKDIRHTYTLGYVSDDVNRDAAFRRLRVVVRAPEGKRVVVRTRAGYSASGGGVK